MSDTTPDPYLAKEAELQRLLDGIRDADLRNDPCDGVGWRIQYISEALFSGRYDQTLVHFTWVLSVCDKDDSLRRQFSHHIHWCFKWMIGLIVKYPEVTRQQIEKTFSEMTRWYDRAGLSHRAIHSQRIGTALVTGDIDTIPSERDQWLRAPADGSQDCAACEAAKLVDAFEATRDYRQTVEVGRPLIEKRLKCKEQPHFAHAVLLLPLFYLGDLETAQQLQRSSFRKIIVDPNAIYEMSRFMAFLVATNQTPRALQMAEAALSVLRHVRRGWDRYYALMGIRLVARRLQILGKTTVKLRLPAHHPLQTPEAICSVNDLFKWAHEPMQKIGAAFDARNGNTYVSNLAEEYEALLHKIQKIPKPPKAEA